MTVVPGAVSDTFLVVFGIVAILALVPIIWSIVDVVRRPAWQFTTARKAIWVATLVVGWLVLWPLALISSLFYLLVIRRRIPPAAAAVPAPSAAVWDPFGAAGERPPPLPAAGWYPDPAGQPAERWWDGRGWTDLLRGPSGGPGPSGRPDSSGDPDTAGDPGPPASPGPPGEGGAPPP